MRAAVAPEVRFWGRVTGGDVTSCWTWLAYVAPDGYGRFYPHKGAPVLAHRWSYEAMRAAIPTGLVIDHLCRHRACVNPWHLEPVTDRVNILRGTSPGARSVASGRCGRGHLFDEENTIVRPDGSRRCRACNRDSCAAWRKR